MVRFSRTDRRDRLSLSFTHSCGELFEALVRPCTTLGGEDDWVVEPFFPRYDWLPYRNAEDAIVAAFRLVGEFLLDCELRDRKGVNTP